jgi:hypothetical protein
MTKTVDKKKCPFCAELIKVEAKICRFCQKEIVAAGDSDKVSKNLEKWKKNDARSLSDIAITCPCCLYEGKMRYVEKAELSAWFRYDYWICFILISGFLFFINLEGDWGIGLFLTVGLWTQYLGWVVLLLVILRFVIINNIRKSIWECPNCNEQCEALV